MKKYLTIGEVSRIKNVSAKALRYYEQLGILIPAYVNEDTGYRYYAIEQLLIVELIRICIDLDIPLKKFKEYVDEQGLIDIQHLLLDGQQMVNSKMQTLQTAKQFLLNVSNHVNRTNFIKDQQGAFEETFEDRYFLTVDHHGDLSDYRAVNMLYTQLFEQTKELGMPDNFNQGFFSIDKEDRSAIKIFLEIPKPMTPPANLYFLPGGKFLCKTLPFTEFANIHEPTGFFIVQELFDLQISPHERLVEIQRPLSNTGKGL